MAPGKIMLEIGGQPVTVMVEREQSASPPGYFTIASGSYLIPRKFLAA